MRSKLIIFLSVFSLLGVFGVQQSNAQKVYYYVLDTVLDDGSSDTKNRPCVSNVMKISQDDAKHDDIVAQFRDFFNTSHKRKSGGWEVNSLKVRAHSFESASDAEAERRRLIAGYDTDYYGSIYLVTDFSFVAD